MKAEEYWNYETKCRRCGKLAEWVGPLKSTTTDQRFLEMMVDQLHTPRLFHCDVCEKQTVQDVVSY